MKLGYFLFFTAILCVQSIALAQNSESYYRLEVEENPDRLISARVVSSDKIPQWAKDVNQVPASWKKNKREEAYFLKPIPFVLEPNDSTMPFYAHNHQPSITWLSNGDLLAVWYST